jgi:hypothetical protein
MKDLLKRGCADQLRSILQVNTWIPVYTQAGWFTDGFIIVYQRQIYKNYVTISVLSQDKPEGHILTVGVKLLTCFIDVKNKLYIQRGGLRIVVLSGCTCYARFPFKKSVSNG